MTTLTQAQNETLVRLMLAARYQDKRLSLAEEEAFKKLLNTLKWDSMKEIGLFAQRETAMIRKAIENEISLTNFINAQCAAFTDKDTQAQCMKMLEAVMKADEDDVRENEFLQKITAAFPA